MQNLANASYGLRRQAKRAAAFRGGTPLEISVNVARSKAPSIEGALIDSVSQIRGAFSLALLTKDRLIAVRDPNGFRPLALGQLGDAWIVCSETCALDFH